MKRIVVIVFSVWLCFYTHLGFGGEGYPAHVERAVLLYSKGFQTFTVVELCKQLGANSNELTKAYANWLQRNKDTMDQAHQIQLEYTIKEGFTAKEANQMNKEIEEDMSAEMWIEMKNDKDYWLQNCQDIPRLLRAGQLDL